MAQRRGAPGELQAANGSNAGALPRQAMAHLRRIAHRSRLELPAQNRRSARLRKRQKDVPEPIQEIAWKGAALRLHKRYARLAAAAKDQRKIVTPWGRELLGFIWAIGVKVKTAARQSIAA